MSDDKEALSLDQTNTKTEVEAELAKCRAELQEAHEICDRVGSDSRNLKPDATKEVELRLPARLNRLVAESHGAILKLLGGSRA
jgi:hypothetical protein